MDNEAFVDEEQDLIALLANQGEDNDEEYEDESDYSVPETVEELKAALLKEREIKSKRNKSLKKAKQAVHRANDEKTELERRLDELERRVTSAQPNNDGAEKLERQAQEWIERVEADPTKAIEYADWKQSMLEQNLSNYLAQFKSEITQQLADLGSRTNPDRLKYESEITMLRSNPKFAGLNEDVLIELAKGLKGAAKPRGSVGGKRVGKESDKGALGAEELEKIRAAVRGGF